MQSNWVIAWPWLFGRNERTKDSRAKTISNLIYPLRKHNLPMHNWCDANASLDSKRTEFHRPVLCALAIIGLHKTAKRTNGWSQQHPDAHQINFQMEFNAAKITNNSPKRTQPYRLPTIYRQAKFAILPAALALLGWLRLPSSTSRRHINTNTQILHTTFHVSFFVSVTSSALRYILELPFSSSRHRPKISYKIHSTRNGTNQYNRVYWVVSTALGDCRWTIILNSIKSNYMLMRLKAASHWTLIIIGQWLKNWLWTVTRIPNEVFCRELPQRRSTKKLFGSNRIYCTWNTHVCYKNKLSRPRRNFSDCKWMKFCEEWLNGYAIRCTHTLNDCLF